MSEPPSPTEVSGGPPISWRRIGVAVAVPVSIVVAVTGLWMTRAHEISYRAHAVGCTAQIAYTSADAEWVRLDVRDGWEGGPFDVTHGRTVNLLVSGLANCREGVSCEVFEDGVSVVRARGTHGAACSAYTAR